ncbi:MAG TPA: type II toxin-antitoxin system PemK/MazF family toxin [Candidatus Acidoferrales bacterium]|jgi:mRNA-degrading endonuclease toxin of MazEF toxin-antitoxin module|nr:type II toxin-antitoxin system PemK/MazF family toxin [Candidatus Acidoferrales bacterium]
MPLDPNIPIDAGDIYWVNLPSQGGSEQSGRRPCIVMSRRSVNTGNTVVIVPMSSKIGNAAAWRVVLPLSEMIVLPGELPMVLSVALCHHVRSADKRKFGNKIGKLTQNAVFSVQLGLSYVFDMR